MSARGTCHKFDHDAAMALIADGVSMASVARQFGVTRERVRQICAQRGVVALSGHHDYDLREFIASHPDMSSREIAEQTGRNIGAVQYTARAIGVKLEKKYPRPTADKIAALAATGMTDGEVARELGIRQSYVSLAKRRFGIVFLRDGRSA